MSTSRIAGLVAVLLAGAWLLVHLLTDAPDPASSPDKMAATESEADEAYRKAAALRGSGIDGEPGEGDESDDEGSREDNRPTLERARSALEPGEAPPRVELVARVLGRDGKPAAGAEATLVSPEGSETLRVGSDGLLRATMTAGTYDLYVRAPDGILLVRGLRVDGVGQTELSLTEPGTIVVQVKRGDELVPDVEVRAEPIGSLAELLRTSETTDAVGIARLTPLPAGTYRITGSVPQGPEILVEHVELGHGTEETVTIDVPEAVRIHGVVRERGEGPPIPNARIAIEVETPGDAGRIHIDITTDGDGSFDVTAPQGRPVRFLVEAEGYAPFPAWTEDARRACLESLSGLSGSEPVHYDIELGRGATLACVVQSDEETPMPGVVVGLRREGEPEPFARATSDAQGQLRIPNLAAGTFVLMVLTQGLYTSDTRRAEVRVTPEDELVEETLRVHAARRIQGTLLTADGQGAGAARVWILAEGLAPFATGFGDHLERYVGEHGETIVTQVAETYTASDGSFVLTDVPIHHDLTFFVRAARGAEQAPPAALPHPEGRFPPEPVALRLAPAASLSGTLTELSSGDPLPGVIVDVIPATRMEGLVRRRLRTRADGSFGVQGIRPGKWLLVAHPPSGFIPANPGVLTLGPKPTTVDLELTRAITVEGTVVDEEGGAVAGANVSVVLVSGSRVTQSYTIPADENGQFRITHAANDADYTLNVSHRGYETEIQPFPRSDRRGVQIVLRRLRKPSR